MNCSDNMECIDCAEYPQDPGVAFIIPGKCRAGMITTGGYMGACEKFSLIESSPETTPEERRVLALESLAETGMVILERLSEMLVNLRKIAERKDHA